MRRIKKSRDPLKVIRFAVNLRSDLANWLNFVEQHKDLEKHLPEALVRIDAIDAVSENTTYDLAIACVVMPETVQNRALYWIYERCPMCYEEVLYHLSTVQRRIAYSQR